MTDTPITDTADTPDAPMTSYEEMIKEVAAKNRYSVKESDTVMALVTILNRVALDWEASQNAALEKHKNEYEACASRWRKDATKRAEVIINASLAAGREAMAKGMSEGAEKVLELMRRDTRNDLRAALAGHQAGMQQATEEFKRYVAYMLGGSAAAVAAMAALVAAW